jgi:large subunit ribosomal protein L32
LTAPGANLTTLVFIQKTASVFTLPAHYQTFFMANPKRKQSKRRSANRRAANAFKAPQVAKDTDGGAFRPHRVNPKTGMYRGRQVLDVEV